MKKKHLLLLIPVSALFSCTAHHMATADKAYERMAFSKAACNYEKVLHKNGDREAAIRAAESYQRQNDHAKAADWYAFADRISPLNDAQALRYAQILISLDRLDDAKVQLERKIAADPDHVLANELLKAASERSAFYMDSALYTVRPVQLEGIAGAFSASHFKNGLIF